MHTYDDETFGLTKGILASAAAFLVGFSLGSAVMALFGG